MKNGFKLFLLVCFMFTFVFSLAFAGDGDPPVSECELGCCVIEATISCNAGYGTESMSGDFVCVCVPNPPVCDPPQCF